MSAASVARAGLSAVFEGLVRRPVAVTMVFLAAVVFGFVSYQRLPVELMPDVSYPTITVRTSFEGAAPQEVEAQVSRPIEAQLATLDGLARLESRSRAGQSDVVLGFTWGTDMSDASQAVREKLQTIFLPEGTERPLILRYDPSLDPFLRLVLSISPEAAAELADGDTALLYTLREVAEREIQRPLEGMAGVAAVRVRGGLSREIRVAVDRDKLTARRLTIDDVRTALSAGNVNLAGGSILEGDTEYLVRTLNELRTVEQIGALKIRRADGVAVPLADVAAITEEAAERQVVSHLGGVEAVEIEIFKEAGSNVVEVASDVKDRLLRPGTPTLPTTHPMYQAPGVAGTLPDGVVLEVLDDQAAFIEASIGNLLNTAATGAVFAVLVLFLFLRNFRATLIIGVSIPLSVIVAFAPLYLLDVTLNLMSLGGLALGVGMLVDNAVVVLESVQRYRDDGEDLASAAVLGTADVASAVTASTLTTVAVFFPITFVEGVAGELFGDLAVAVVASLLASLAVALFLVPMLAALELPSIATAEGEDLLGTVRAARGGRAGLREIGGALVRDVVSAPREVVGRWLASVGQAGPAARLGAAAAERPASWRWVLAPWVAFHAAVVLGFGIALTAATVAALVAVAIVGGVSAVLGATVGRALLGLSGAFLAVYARIEDAYGRALAASLRRTGVVVVAAVAAVVVAGVVGSGLGTELLPQVHQGRLVIDAAMPVGTPLMVTVRALGPLERAVLAHPDVRSVYASFGSDGGADARPDEGEHTATLRVALAPGPAWFGPSAADREARVMEGLRAILADFPRVDARVGRPELFEVSTPIEVVVYGHDLDDLRVAGDRTVQALEDLPALRDVSTSLARGYPEVQIHYDRERLRRLGLDPSTVATRVRDQVLGVRATSIQRAEQRLDVRVQLVAAQRASVADLRALNVNPDKVPPIPLDTVARLVEGEGPSEIRRVDQRRAVVVGASVAGFDLGTAAEAIGERLAGVTLPPGTDAVVAGQSRELRESLASMGFALLLAVFLVYIIMASTFEDVIQPLVILLSVPLAAVGVAVTLAVVGLPISVVVLIGAIVLAGVVVNNAIVFIDAINRRRARGEGRDEAIVASGRLRLRPILITTFTTVLGLLPLSFGLGDGAEVQQPLAITVIGGLVSSTLLTLVVVPVVYRLFDLRGAAERAR